MSNTTNVKHKTLLQMILGLVVVAVLIAIDHITKYWAYTDLRVNGAIPIIKGVFSLSYAQNSGAAWGLFSGSQMLNWLPIILGIVLLFIYQRLPQTKRMLPLNISLLALIAGAIGNRIDRSVYGYVQDFLYFELIDFPIFNIADCYIVCSTIFMGLLIIFYYKDESEFDGIFFSKKNTASGDNLNDK